MRSSFFTGETSSYGALGLRDGHSSGRHWRLGRTEQDIESWSGYMVKHVDMLNIYIYITIIYLYIWVNYNISLT